MTVRRASLALLLALGTAVAQGPPTPRGWEQLSPQEQRRARENWERYQKMPAPQRRALDERFQRFQAMPPQEQERVRRNYESLRRQAPAQREQFDRKYRRWKQSDGR